MRHKIRVLSLVATASLSLPLLSGGMSWASDGVVYDGDLLDAGAYTGNGNNGSNTNENLVFASACPGTSIAPDGANLTLAVSNSGLPSGNQASEKDSFLNDATVTFAAPSAAVTTASGTLTGIVLTSPATVVLPHTWESAAAGTFSASILAKVSLQVPADATPGPQSATVAFTASGNGYTDNAGTNGSVVRTANVSVSWTVLDRASTDCAGGGSGGTGGTGGSVDPCLGAPTPAPPTITAIGGTGGTAATSNWYTSAPTVSASGTAVMYATIVNDGTKSGFGSVAPVLGNGTTIVYATQTVCGLTSAESLATYKVDGTAPTIVDAGYYSGTAGLNGWYTTAVANRFTASDNTNGSGLAGASPIDVSTGSVEGSGLTVSSGDVYDVAGNKATSKTSAASYNVDLNDPTVTCDSSPVFVLGTTGNVVSGTVSDTTLGSGPLATSVSAPAVTTSVGPQTVKVTGYDNAGRSGYVNCSYSVIYNWSGFFQPIDSAAGMGNDSYPGTTPNTIYNKVKAGSGIPVKFNLGGYQGLGVMAANFPQVKVTNCSTSSAYDPVEETVTANASSLKYDATANGGAGQYIYTWKTNTAWVSTCQRLEVKLIDGTSHFAFFNFTK